MSQILFQTGKAVRQCQLNLFSKFSTTSKTLQIPDALYKSIDLELRAHNAAVLKSYSWFANSAAKELDINVEKSYAPEEPHKRRKTLLRSAYVHKKHRVQYEMQTYYHFMTLRNMTGSTADTYLEYVQRNLPEGVSMKVIRHEVKKHLPHLVPPQSEPSELS